MAKGKSRAVFRDSRGRFAKPRARGVRVYVGGKRLRGKQRERVLRERARQIPGRLRGRLSKGFPRGYTSPFRAFITPVSKARSPERAFALVEIISRRKYEGTAFRNWIPFDMGYMEPGRARRLVVGDVEEAFKLSNLKGKNDLSKVFGFYMLKPDDARQKVLTPRLLRLIKHRARHGNEYVKPERPKKKGKRGKR